MIAVRNAVMDCAATEAIAVVSTRPSISELAAVVEQVDDLVCICSPESEIEYVNPAFERHTGYAASEVIGKTPRILKSGRHDAAFYRRLWATILRGEPFSDVFLNRKKSGELYYEAKTISVMRDRRSRVTHYVSTGKDVTGRTLAEAALRESEQQLRQLASNIPEAYWIEEVGSDRILYLSPGFVRITGWRLQPGSADTQHLRDIVFPEDHKRVLLAASNAPRGGLDEQYRIVRPDGSLRWVHTRTFPITGSDGAVYRLAGVMEDISDRKAGEEQLTQMALYDTLTNLPNRTLFYRSVQQTIANARENGRSAAVLFLDLDRFKNVNDTLGHTVGDDLLREVATRLVRSIRVRDTLGRLGGDEFAILLPHLEHPDDAANVADKILKALAEPFVLEGEEMFITASIGITIYPTDGEDTDTLIRAADTAMYRAKGAGRNGYRFYTAGMNERARERLQLESRLRRAVEREEFVLHYQPKFDLGEGRVTGLEALIRWNDPEKGLVAPGLFIALLEETGMIVEVGAWALKQAASQYAAWQAAGLRSPRISVNVSQVQLKRKDFVATVQQALAAAGGAAHGLDLEITESMVMEDIQETIEKLKAVRALGMGIEIDDFGTGYSSLQYVARLPVTALKIDRAFVRDMAADANDMSMISTIISLAHNLNLKVIAEGVETEEQAGLLRLLKCDEAQGYLYSKPVPAEEIGAMLRQRAGHAARRSA